VLAALTRWRTEGSLSPGFWPAGLEALAACRALPTELRVPVVLLLARSVQRLFTRAPDGDWQFLERPRVVEEAVVAVLGGGAPDRFDRRWSRMSRRARLAFAVLVTATDSASWLVELRARGTPGRVSPTPCGCTPAGPRWAGGGRHRSPAVPAGEGPPLAGRTRAAGTSGRGWTSARR
jgi:hypothetical protein